MSKTEVNPNVLENKPVIICPGFHPAKLTAQFVQSVFNPTNGSPLPPLAVYPLVVDAFCANPAAVLDWLTQTLGSPKDTEPVLAIGFSGGVVGIAGALVLWQQQGGKVAKLIAIDGWGMPIVGLPVCRLSHDSFTHWSTLPIGSGKVNFYADPAVEHLQMWGNPDQVTGQMRQGWQTQNGERTTVTEFVRQVLTSSTRAV